MTTMLAHEKLWNNGVAYIGPIEDINTKKLITWCSPAVITDNEFTTMVSDSSIPYASEDKDYFILTGMWQMFFALYFADIAGEEIMNYNILNHDYLDIDDHIYMEV